MRPIDAYNNDNGHAGVHKDFYPKLKSYEEYTCNGERFHKLRINQGDRLIIEFVESSSSMVGSDVTQTQSRGKLRHLDFSTNTSGITGRPSIVSGRNDKKQKREPRDWYSSLVSSNMTNSGDNENLHLHNNNDGKVHQLKVTTNDEGNCNNIYTRDTSTEFDRGSSSKHDNSVSTHNAENCTKERENVKVILKKFRTLCDELLREKQANLKNNRKVNRRVDLQAAKILAKQLVYTGDQYIGHVPGIEVGDEFFYRMEMRVVCLHHPPMAGIDSTFHAGKRIATSVVVASGYYDNNLGDPEVLIYCGQGGNSKINGHGEDQIWSYGNVSLKNSIDVKNPVRVICNTRHNNTYETTFVYQGLFQVVNYWKERGMDDKITFKFKLIRLSGQQLM